MRSGSVTAPTRLMHIRQSCSRSTLASPLRPRIETPAKETLMTGRALGALALLATMATPAAAAAPPGPRWPGTRWVVSDDGDRMAAAPLEDAAAPDRIQGKVLAIDPQHGTFVLGTDAGAIALYADPEDLAELQIGQTLEVEMIDDPSADDRTARRPTDH
jgi:hypothetical protein